jgi:hypothetical protein
LLKAQPTGLFVTLQVRRQTAFKQLLQTPDVDAGTCRVTTGHNGDDGRGAILPVSARDNNASVRADI